MSGGDLLTIVALAIVIGIFSSYFTLPRPRLQCVTH